MIEDAIYSILSADPAVAGVVGTRIFPVMMPEQVGYPALSFQTISADEFHTLDRSSGLVHQRLQIDAWGNRYRDVKLLQKKVRDVLEATYGYFDGPNGPVNINGILREDERDSYEKETRTYRCGQDFLIFYND